MRRCCGWATVLFLVLNSLMTQEASSRPLDAISQYPEVQNSQAGLPLCYIQTADGRMINLEKLCGSSFPAKTNSSGNTSIPVMNNSSGNVRAPVMNNSSGNANIPVGTNSSAPLPPVPSRIGASRGYNPDAIRD